MKNKRKTLHDHFIVIQRLYIIGFLIMLSAILLQEKSFIGIPWVLGFLVMLFGVLYQEKYYRCPHCGSKQLPRQKVPRYCPNCGKELN